MSGKELESQRIQFRLVFVQDSINKDLPPQAPEAPIDNRSLFEKLQEQKDIKEMKWQEEHAFKNNTFNKGLEEDEAEFLDAVDAARQFQFENMHFTRG